jgi:biotin transport system substrate-specific component
MGGTLVSRIAPGFGASLLGRCLIVFVGTVLLAVSAKVQVPFWPVPATMQTFVVLVMAMACGPVLGTAAVLGYLIEGALGLPVFSGTPERPSGIAYMIGPTGGYMAGMLLASLVVGWLSVMGWARSRTLAMIAMLIGCFIIFAFGFAWLAVLMGPAKAWAVGVVPFLLSEALKVLLAGIVVPAAWSMRRAD